MTAPTSEICSPLQQQHQQNHPQQQCSEMNDSFWDTESESISVDADCGFLSSLCSCFSLSNKNSLIHTVTQKLQCKDSPSNEFADLPETVWLDKQHVDTRLLLLGTSDCGKTTFRRLISKLFRKTKSQRDLCLYSDIVRSQIARDCKEVIALLNHNSGTKERSKSEIDLTFIDELLNALKNLDDIQSAKLLLVDFFHSEATQELLEYHNRKLLQISDNLEHFLSNIDTILKQSYLPTFGDISRLKVMSTGIDESSFHKKHLEPFSILDVGGSRAERHKWQLCSLNSGSVLYFISLSEFDQRLFEDRATSRLSESLEVWKEICKQNMVREKIFHLIFTKSDILAAKLQNKSVNFKHFCPSFDGDEHNTVEVLSHIIELYLAHLPPNMIVHRFNADNNNGDDTADNGNLAMANDDSATPPPQASNANQSQPRNNSDVMSPHPFTDIKNERQSSDSVSLLPKRNQSFHKSHNYIDSTETGSPMEFYRQPFCTVTVLNCLDESQVKTAFGQIAQMSLPLKSVLVKSQKSGIQKK